MNSKQKYEDALKINKKLKLELFKANSIIKAHQRKLKQLRYKKWWQFWK